MKQLYERMAGGRINNCSSFASWVFQVTAAMPMLQGKLIQAAQSSALPLSTAPWTADLAQAAQGVVDRRKKK